MRHTLITTLIAIFCFTTIVARDGETDNAKRWRLSAQIGFNIGGTSPLPLPEEIREIKSYSPGLAPAAGIEIKYLFSNDMLWGISSGLYIERKSMFTKAKVKNYHTEIIGENNNKLRGNWTGDVHTDSDNWYLTMPILATYNINSLFNIKAGVFLSYLANGEFSGYVNSGYLRKDNPTGNKIIFDSKSKGEYDFSNQLNKFSWGMMVGMDYSINQQIKIHTNLTWGLNEIFKSDFNTISFDMYPIYLNIGAGYNF